MQNISTRTALISKKYENLILIKMKDGIEMGAEEESENLQAGTKLANNKKHLVLVDGRCDLTIDDEGRRFMAGAETAKYRIAVAVIANNIAVQLLINFLVKFHKPLTPTALFSSERDALVWLKTFESDLVLSEEERK